MKIICIFRRPRYLRAVHWYANQQNAEVITYRPDVGQEEELDGLEEKALRPSLRPLHTRFSR